MVEMFMDFAIASTFIFIGQLLRAKVKLFQKMFVPASLIGGFIALFLGNQFLNVLNFSEFSGDYAWVLVVVVFASVGLPGISFSKAEGERIGSYFMYKLAMFVIQFSIPVLFAILVLKKIDPNIENGFGILLASGFVGGHGTAAAVGSTFAKLGYTDATDIAMTFATAGVLTGIFGGLAFIKWATSKGYTQYVKDFSAISDDLKTGMVQKENREGMGVATVSSISIEPLCWHLALLLIPSAIGIWIVDVIAGKTGISLPEFSLGFLVALVFSVVLKKTGLNEYIDYKVTDRISGLCTDFIVFFGVAKIKIAVIIKYALPLSLMLFVGILIVFLTVAYFGPRMNKKSWFERSIFVYGYSTGVFAIGMILLRIVDPNMESATLQDTGFCESFQTVLELICWSTGPYMLYNGQGLIFGGIMLLIFVGSIVIARMCKWWYKEPLGERGAISESRSSN